MCGSLTVLTCTMRIFIVENEMRIVRSVEYGRYVLQGMTARSRSQRSSKGRPQSPQPSRSPLGARASAPASVQVTIGDDADDSKYAARRVDKISRKCFPLAFLLFNVGYWIMYTLPGDADTSST